MRNNQLIDLSCGMVLRECDYLYSLLLGAAFTLLSKWTNVLIKALRLKRIGLPSMSFPDIFVLASESKRRDWERYSVGRCYKRNLMPKVSVMHLRYNLMFSL